MATKKIHIDVLVKSNLSIWELQLSLLPGDSLEKLGGGALNPGACWYSSWVVGSFLVHKGQG